MLPLGQPLRGGRARERERVKSTAPLDHVGGGDSAVSVRRDHVACAAPAPDERGGVGIARAGLIHHLHAWDGREPRVEPRHEGTLGAAGDDGALADPRVDLMSGGEEITLGELPHGIAQHATTAAPESEEGLAIPTGAAPRSWIERARSCRASDATASMRWGSLCRSTSR